MKDRLRAENSHQRVCSLGNVVETVPTIYFPPSHHSSQHRAHIILSSAHKLGEFFMVSLDSSNVLTVRYG